MIGEKQFVQNFIPYRTVVQLLCKQILQDDEAANDATQDVFLQLWLKHETLDMPANPKAYLMRMARNHCIDELRKAETSAVGYRTDEEVLAQLPTPEVNREERMVHREKAQRLMQWVRQLREPKHSLFVMAHFRHCSNDEIAETLGLSGGNVRVMLSRLRAEAKKLLND